MKKRDKDIERIEEALILSRRKPVEPDVGPLWEVRVMSRILDERVTGKSTSANGSKYSGTVWRFAMAACLVALLLANYLMDSELDVQFQMVELIQDDDAGVDLARSFMSL